MVPGDLDQGTNQQSRFRLEKVVLGAGDLIAVRGLFQEAGVQAERGARTREPAIVATMNPVTDALTAAESLEDAGVPRRQAAAHARAIDAGCGTAVEDLPTRAMMRADLKALEVRLLLYGASLAGLLFAALRFG